MITANEDYRLAAVGGPAGGWGLMTACFRHLETLIAAKRRAPRVPTAARRLALRLPPVVFFCLLFPTLVASQTPTFTHADTIRGSNTPERSWWDASFYDLHVKVNPVDSSITGHNAITYRVLKPAPRREM